MKYPILLFYSIFILNPFCYAGEINNNGLKTVNDLKKENLNILSNMKSIMMATAYSSRDKYTSRSYKADIKVITNINLSELIRRVDEVLSNRGWIKYEVLKPQNTFTYCRGKNNFLHVGYANYEKYRKIYLMVSYRKDGYKEPCKLRPGQDMVLGVKQTPGYNVGLVLLVAMFFIWGMIFIIRYTSKDSENKQE